MKQTTIFNFQAVLLYMKCIWTTVCGICTERQSNTAVSKASCCSSNRSISGDLKRFSHLKQSPHSKQTCHLLWIFPPVSGVCITGPQSPWYSQLQRVWASHQQLLHSTHQGAARTALPKGDFEALPAQRLNSVLYHWLNFWKSWRIVLHWV